MSRCRVRLDDPVHTDVPGEVSTCGQLLDESRAYVEIWHRYGRATPEYLCVLLKADGTEHGAFSISKFAYEFRAARGQTKVNVNKIERRVDV